MSEISVEELAIILQKDSEWMSEHYEELIEKYPGQLVAIDNEKIVAVGDKEVENYCAKQRNANLISPLVLAVPYPDNLMPFLI